MAMAHKAKGKSVFQVILLLFALAVIFLYADGRQKLQQRVWNFIAEEASAEKHQVNNPRVNYMENPVGIDNGDIKFSWEPSVRQKAYEIIVRCGDEIVWDSGIVRTEETIQVPYQGKPLENATRYTYRIYVMDGEQQIYDSGEAFFETAFVTGEPFLGAEFISMNPEENIYEDGQAVYYTTFKKEEKPLKKATFYGSALGVYDAYLNGRRIGEDELKPGWTDYEDTLLYNTYDITSYVKETNTIASMVGTGWWCGRNGFGTYGYNQPAFICQILLEYEDGTSQTVHTGENWNYTKNTAVRSADFFNGETCDFSRLTTEQISGGEKVPAEDVKPVCCSYTFDGQYKSYYGYNVKHVGELDCNWDEAYVYSEMEEDGTDFGYVKTNPVTDFPVKLKKGETLIVDLGQNMTGVPYVEYTARPGTKIRIQFAEMLNDSGEAERGNDGPKGTLYRANYRSATTEIVIMSGEGEKESYAPEFFYTGFRYLSLTADEDVTMYDVKGLFIGNSSPVSGSLTSDDGGLNRLWQNVMWSQRNNFLLVATDCPQRDERLGWMGDISSFAGTSMYNQDLYSFYKKWMEDVRDAQTGDGAYTDTVPYVVTTGSGNGGWAEAGILVPLEIYRKYGDRELLQEHYPSMKRYMNYLASISSYKPEDKRMGPLTTYGDWLSVQLSDANLLSALWYQADAMAMQETAGLLGETEDAREYRKLYEEINEYIMETYQYKMPWERDGTKREREKTEYTLSQTEMLFLLRYSMLTEKQEQLMVADLKEDIEANDYKVMTGFAGTPILLRVLTEYGMQETAYRILLGGENPSWMYSVNQGATTIWERYDSYTAEEGFADAGMNSFNHFNEGSVAEWMYESMLGICVDMTQKEPIIIRPQIPSDDIPVRRAEGSYDSVYGLISLAWEKLEGGEIKITLTLPANTKARIFLPISGSENMVVTGGTYEWSGEYKLLE